MWKPPSVVLLCAVSLMPGLLAGTASLAADGNPGKMRSAFFSGALSYESLAVPDSVGEGRDALSAGDFSIDLYRSETAPLGFAVGTGFQRDDQGSDPDGYMVGLRVDYGGLSVASQWFGAQDSACGLSEHPCDAGPAWNIGASYSAGAASLSAQYQAMNPLGGQERGPVGDVFRLGIDYQIFDGVSSRADAYYIDGDTGRTDRDATVVLIGTRITF